MALTSVPPADLLVAATSAPPAYAAITAFAVTDRLDVLTDQLELLLTGGQPSADSPYPWPFLRLCVQESADAEANETAFKNAASRQADYLARKKDEQDSYFLDLKAKTDFWETPDRWLQSFPAPLHYDADRQEQYFILPPAFVALRRYQNLPSENTVREVMPRNRVQRPRYRFAYTGTSQPVALRQPGGLLGRWGYYTEQTTSAPLAEQYRVYLVPNKPGAQILDAVPLLATYVLRDSRTSGLPDPPLLLVEDFAIVRRAMELALLRTRQDKVMDSNPQPTQIQQ